MQNKLGWHDVRDFRVLLATGFGLGFAKLMPGTVASLFAVAVWFFWLSELRGFYQSGIIIAALPLAYYVIHVTQQKVGVEDDSAITIDEILGQWAALIAAPKTWYIVLFAFVAFRVLDIYKPDPVGWAERRFKGPLGVLADDLVAGALVTAVIHISVYWFGLGGQPP
ncbi:MAG: phosphatidylglycerophosphatase A [Gammaproteobacteria bacterium]|nr:phosphatidylglycerophosphatase A [Gammaproteobacteria bacterium]